MPEALASKAEANNVHIEIEIVDLRGLAYLDKEAAND